MPAHGLPSPRRLFFRCAAVCVQTHPIFREGHGRLLVAFITLLKQPPAQQRKFLHANAISSDERKIRPDRICAPRSIAGNARKCEHADVCILSESCEDELHLLPRYGMSIGDFAFWFRRLRAARRMAVTCGVVFANQAILPGQSPHLITNFKHESGWLAFHERRIGFLQVS